MNEPRPPSILLLHDGELADVHALLDELDASPVCARAHEPPRLARARRDLVVTTARLALAHPDCLANAEADLPPARVVIASEDSPALRRQLRATGFDYLVRRPVDPAALRLLFVRLLYQGPERRRSERSFSGREVSYTVGSRSRHAILGDLSESGCRLLHATPAREGQRIAIDVPVASEEGATLRIAGTVLRAVPAHPGEGGSTIAVAFDALRDAELERLRSALGTGVIAGEAAHRPAHPPRERRGAPRGTFRKRVVALRAEADRVLMGCDLSTGGMRVEPHPTLAVGERLRLAIYAEPNAEPWIVGACVVRNDASGGLGLRFDVLPPQVAHRLEAFVATLPPFEPLQRGEAGALGAVLAQILD